MWPILLTSREQAYFYKGQNSLETQPVWYSTPQPNFATVEDSRETNLGPTDDKQQG